MASEPIFYGFVNSRVGVAFHKDGAPSLGNLEWSPNVPRKRKTIFLNQTWSMNFKATELKMNYENDESLLMMMVK